MKGVVKGWCLYGVPVWCVVIWMLWVWLSSEGETTVNTKLEEREKRRTSEPVSTQPIPSSMPMPPARAPPVKDSCEEIIRKGKILASTLVTFPIESLRDHFEALKIKAEQLQDCHVWEKTRQGDKQLGRKAARRVWIDLGSRSLDATMAFETKYPNGRSFDKYCFEPNPKFQDFYVARPDVRYLPFAVSIANATTELSDADVGSSIVANIKKTHKTTGLQTVPSINFPEWLRTNTDPSDFVVLKMDIEFAEFAVLHHLLHTSLITHVDELLLECHYRTTKSRQYTPKEGEERPISRYECKNLVHTIELAGLTSVNWNKKNYHADLYSKRHGGFHAT